MADLSANHGGAYTEVSFIVAGALDAEFVLTDGSGDFVIDGSGHRHDSVRDFCYAALGVYPQGTKIEVTVLNHDHPMDTECERIQFVQDLNPTFVAIMWRRGNAST